LEPPDGITCITANPAERAKTEKLNEVSPADTEIGDEETCNTDVFEEDTENCTEQGPDAGVHGERYKYTNIVCVTLPPAKLAPVAGDICNVELRESFKRKRTLADAAVLIQKSLLEVLEEANFIP
jgi:hypothetical protein